MTKLDTAQDSGLVHAGSLSRDGVPQDGVPLHDITMRDAFWVWVKVAIYSFGGPAGQIAW